MQLKEYVDFWENNIKTNKYMKNMFCVYDRAALELSTNVSLCYTIQTC
jgi:hypothetical protein